MIPTVEDMRQGKLRPVYFLFVDEEYLVDQALRRFMDHAVDPAQADFNRDLFYGEDLRGEELFRLAASYPMLAERRLVVVRGIERAPKRVHDDLLVYLEQPSETTCLVLGAGKVDRRRKVFQALKQRACAMEFKRLAPARLPGWMIDRCRERDFELPRELALQLAEQLAEAPLRMVAGELDKLMLLVPPERGGRIGAEEAACALGMEPEATAFNLADAVFAREAGRALSILGSLLRASSASYGLLPALQRGFARSWYIARLRDAGRRSSEMARLLGNGGGRKLGDWQIKKDLERIRGWDTGSIVRACGRLLEADLALKGGSPLSEKQILSSLVLELCRI